jgi:hypothetical protein
MSSRAPHAEAPAVRRGRLKELMRAWRRWPRRPGRRRAALWLTLAALAAALALLVC